MRETNGPPPMRLSCGELQEEREGDLPPHEEGDRGQQGHRPAQEGPGEDPDGRQDHRLEPDAEEPLEEVRAEVARVGQDVQVALGHAQVLVHADAPDLDPEVAPRAGQQRGRERPLVGVILPDRDDVAPVGAGPGVGDVDLGLDRLAQPPLGRPVDVERHLQGDRRARGGGRPRHGPAWPRRPGPRPGRRRPSPPARRPAPSAGDRRRRPAGAPRGPARIDGLAGGPIPAPAGRSAASTWACSSSIRFCKPSIVPGGSRRSTAIRRSIRTCGLNGSGTMPKLQIAVEGVAPSMWLRGSFIDCSWPTSIPMTRGMPRESMKLSEPRIGSRARHPGPQLVGLLAEMLGLGQPVELRLLGAPWPRSGGSPCRRSS